MRSVLINVKMTGICLSGNLLCVIIANIYPLLGAILFVGFNTIDTVISIINTNKK